MPTSFLPSTVFTCTFASSIFTFSTGGFTTSSSFTILGGVNCIVCIGGGGGNFSGGGGGGGGLSSFFTCSNERSFTSNSFVLLLSCIFFATTEPTKINNAMTAVIIRARVILLL